MTQSSVIHIVGVTAVWIIFLSSIRFAAVGAHGLRPVLKCVWHLLRCKGSDKRGCRRQLTASLDRQYSDLLIAITTPWSVMLLFAGMVAMGVGLSLASIGDVFQLVAVMPYRWSTLDRLMDLAGAAAMATGMASIHAAVTKRRSLSLIMSTCFAVLGALIGIATAGHP
jgi:hypothetical protein